VIGASLKETDNFFLEKGDDFGGVEGFEFIESKAELPELVIAPRVNSIIRSKRKGMPATASHQGYLLINLILVKRPHRDSNFFISQGWNTALPI
jgi:hypothetical protein